MTTRLEEEARSVIIAAHDLSTQHPIPVVFDVNEQEALHDDLTNALVVMDSIHHEVHEGHFWEAEHNSSSVANSSSLDMRFRVTKDFHFSASVSAGGQSQVFLYEGANIAGGTALTVWNNYRGRGDANPPLSAWHTPAVTSTGSSALVNGRIVVGGTSPQTRVGGAIRSNSEIIVKPNTEYLLRVTNISGAAVAISIAIGGYTS